MVCKMGKIKIAKWDNIKFFLIVCVVLGHFLQRSDSTDMAKGLIFFIYIFHMPAFVFVSGLFSKHAINYKRYDKVFSFFVMFVVTKILRFGAELICTKTSRFELFSINDVSWYAFSICAFYLFTMFLKQFNHVYTLVASVVLACIIGYASDIGAFLALSRIAVFYPFFLLGYYINQEDIINISNKIYIKIISVVIILFTAVISFVKIDSVWWLIKILKGKYSYAALKHCSEYGAFVRLSWYAAALILVFAWITVIPSVKSIFTKWGGRTMQVYVLHYVALIFFFNMFKGNSLVKSIFHDYYLVAICLVSFLVTGLLSIKPITIVMNKIIYPKKITDNKDKALIQEV